MPIIPRYQPRGGPRLQGLDYAGAYRPPGGDDWRMFGRAMEAMAPMVQGAHDRFHRRQDGADGGQGGDDPSPDRSLDPAAVLAGAERGVAWREQQLALNDAADEIDAGAVGLSRQKMGESLTEPARMVFDSVTKPREPGFVAQARAGADRMAFDHWQALALRSEQLGVEEYVRQVEIDEDLGRAALASAVAQRTGRLMAAGASSEDVQAGRRSLMVEAGMARLGRALRAGPEKAEALLADIGHLLPEEAHAQIAGDIGAERLRREAQVGVEAIAAQMEDVADRFEELDLQARAAAGEDPRRQAAFAGAATGFWRRAKAATEAREDAALAAIADRLKSDDPITGWTDLPTEDWRALTDRQQSMLRRHLQAPWRESDPATVGLLKDMAARQPGAFKDFDLMALSGRLNLEDLQAWRGQQLRARTGGGDWRRDQARLAGMARAIDRSGDLAADPQFRAAAYEAFDQARAIKQADLSPDELTAECDLLGSNWLTGPQNSNGGDLIGPWKPSWPNLAPPLKPDMRELEPTRPPHIDGFKRRFIPWENPRIGALSEEAESLGRGPGTASPGVLANGQPDPGGVSYGVYQLTTKGPRGAPGRTQEFLTREGAPWAARLAGAQPGTPAFTKIWKQIAAEDPVGFRAAQHAFIERTHYRVQLANILKTSGIDVSRRSYTLQDAVWSACVQHGPDTPIVVDSIAAARKKYGGGFTDEQLIDEIYALRTVRYPDHQRRYAREGAAARRAIAVERTQYPNKKTP